MINIDFTNIDNAKLIGRLLPFWARGRKLSLLLEALLSPLKATHDRFKIWGLNKYIDCHITAQRLSLEWYLNYKLRSHFHSEKDSFSIIQNTNDTVACFSNETWSNKYYWSNDLLWSENVEDEIGTDESYSVVNSGQWENNQSWSNASLWENEPSSSVNDAIEPPDIGVIRVLAPAIDDTVVYNHEDYERDIRNIMAKFMVCFNRIEIIIANV